MAELRSKPIALKVTPDVHEFLTNEAQRRGISVSMLCAVVIGDWKTNIEDRRSLQQQQAHSAIEAMMEGVSPELQKMLKDLGDS